MLAICLYAALFGQIPGNILVGPTDQPARSRRDPVRVSFVSAKAVELETAVGKQECLQITIKVENLDPKRPLTYVPWTIPNTGGGSGPAYARAASGLKLGDAFAVSRRGEEIIRPKKALTDVLLFEMPPFKETEIVVKFPHDHFKFPEAYATVEPFSWTIPRKEWLKSMTVLAPPEIEGNKEPVVSSIGSIKVSVIEAVIKPVAIEEATAVEITEVPMLHVKLRIENTTETIPAVFDGWSTNAVKTNTGKMLKHVWFGVGRRVKGETQATSIKPREAIETVLVFEPPPRNAKNIDLRLFARGAFIQGSEPGYDHDSFAFTIPNAFWIDYFKREDEARNKAVEKMKPAKKGKN